MKHFSILVISALILAGCIGCQTIPAQKTPKASIKPTMPGPPVSTPSPTIRADVRTPAPDTIEVVLSGGYFSVGDVNGNLITDWSTQPGSIYLPRGEYRWLAQIPIPTMPYGCFVTLEYNGYQKEGSFLASRDRVTIQVKLGSVIAACTPTPGEK